MAAAIMKLIPFLVAIESSVRDSLMFRVAVGMAVYVCLLVLDGKSKMNRGYHQLFISIKMVKDSFFLVDFEAEELVYITFNTGVWLKFIIFEIL